MDRTLFTPSMIETFRACRRAYQLAFLGPSARAEATSAQLKRFLLKAIGEINRGRITTISQVQKFLGQHWPVDKIASQDCVRAFLFAYKTLTAHLTNCYRPQGARTVAVNLTVRARIPHERTYLEDTFDLILWYPAQRRLEFVDYHLHPLKTFNKAWPSASILVKQFLAERLRVRWPFEQLALTFCRIGPQGISTTTVSLDESLGRLHWPDLLATVAAMKEFEQQAVRTAPSCMCTRCKALSRDVTPRVEEGLPACRTA